jgi:F-type H+-transporting ATPase subunit b
LTDLSRFSRRVFWFAILSVMVAGLAVAPRSLRAQEPAATARTTVKPNATAGTDAAPPQTAEKSDQDEENVYLHGSMVQSIAKALHLSVETTAQIFVGINFAILVLCIGIPLSRIFPKVVRKRSQTLRHNLEEARKETEDANARLSAVEAKLASIGGEIAKFRAEVEQEMGRDEQRIKATLEEEKVRIVAGVEQEIDSAAAHARRGLRDFAADLAIEHAARQLVLTPENDRALIAEFVRDVAGKGTVQGGQN